MNLKDCQDIQWLAFTKAGCGGEDAGLLRIGITITIHCMSKTCGTKPKTNPKFKTMQTWRIPSHTFTYLHIPSHTFTIHMFSCFIVFVMSHHMSSPFDILWEPLISASETSWVSSDRIALGAPLLWLVVCGLTSLTIHRNACKVSRNAMYQT